MRISDWSSDVCSSDLARHSVHGITQRRMPMKFVHAVADGAAFETAGLREFFPYRDLGIKDATDGRYHAHFIRAVPAEHHVPPWHPTTLDFQMLHVLPDCTPSNYKGQGRPDLPPPPSA